MPPAGTMACGRATVRCSSQSTTTTPPPRRRSA
jgi:hypothetical protein